MQSLVAILLRIVSNSVPFGSFQRQISENSMVVV